MDPKSVSRRRFSVVTHLIVARRRRHSEERRRESLVVVSDPLDERRRTQRLRDDALQLNRARRLHEDVAVAENPDTWN